MTSLKDPGGEATNSGTDSGQSHSKDKREQDLEEGQNHAAEGARKIGHHCCLLGEFDAFSRWIDALWQGTLVVPDVSAVPLPTPLDRVASAGCACEFHPHPKTAARATYCFPRSMVRHGRGCPSS